MTAPSANGGSLISRVPVPDGSSDYEVRTTLRLTASGGTYVQYLRASSDALSGPAAAGSFFAVELQEPTFNGASCSATLAIYQRVNGVVTLLSSKIAGCRDGMVMSSVMNNYWTGPGWNPPGSIIVSIDGVAILAAHNDAISIGVAGVGARNTPSGNTISLVKLGPQDRIAPSAVNPQSIAVSAFPNKIEFQWQPALDDPNGIGTWRYRISRNGQIMTNVVESAHADLAVTPDTTYTYTFETYDWHMNLASPTTITVQTPPAGHVDPRRIGVRPTGTYWGALGEQIDMLSGNLNFTLPLLKAQGRGGWGVPFALNYNSQLWRQGTGGDWKLGRDVGYGFGWKLLAGSITPYWYGFWAITHYIYTDSTGAEYRLDVNNNGVWSSREAVYVWFDANSQRLYFRDGSFWVMGAQSAGTEQDAGTRYPTLMQDTNGNRLS